MKIRLKQKYEKNSPTAIKGQVPFGYYRDKHDPKLIVPNEAELAALERAYVFLRRCSFKEVARWVTETTGRKLSPQKLHKKYMKLKAQRAGASYERKKRRQVEQYWERKRETADAEQRRKAAALKEGQKEIRPHAGGESQAPADKRREENSSGPGESCEREASIGNSQGS